MSAPKSLPSGSRPVLVVCASIKDYPVVDYYPADNVQRWNPDRSAVQVGGDWYPVFEVTDSLAKLLDQYQALLDVAAAAPMAFAGWSQKEVKDAPNMLELSEALDALAKVRGPRAGRGGR